MKNILIISLLLASTLWGQAFTGKKFALDPGHGFIPGQASNCSDAETKRFESYINHIVVPYLKKYLQKEGAEVITTRADYDSVGPCITLTQRKTIANNANVHYFHSVHHNAFDGTSNYTLSLFKQNGNSSCPNGNPAWPGVADVMANIQSTRIYNALQTTSAIYRGDYCFLGFNLGVLSTLNMAGTLSEASFYDNLPEKTRLADTSYLKTEAEALYHAFLQFYQASFPAHGSLVGVVTNSANNQPAKNVRVAIDSLGLSYLIGTNGSGFYRFDSIPPGVYKVKLMSALDTVTTNVTVVGSTINKRNLALTQTEFVGDVRIKAVLASSSTLSVQWEKPTGTVDSYNIYLSENGVTWDSLPKVSPAGTAVSASIGGLESNKQYYVRIRAKNSIGESPNFSRTYGGFTSNSQDKVLIVDGFNRITGSSSNPAHNYAAIYGDALAAMNFKFETVSNVTITSAAQLVAYKYVFWFLGDESTADETFSATEQLYIRDYLRQGGKIFVTGSEVAWDLDQNGTAADKAFINTYLKARYIADNPTPNTAAGTAVPGSIFDGVPNFTFGQVYPEDWPDVIDTVGGSVPVMRYNATQTAGVAFTGMVSGGFIESKIVYLGFALETMGNVVHRRQIVQKIVNYFTGLTDAEEIAGSFTPSYFAITAYPNPFNPSTKLRVTVPASGEYRISVTGILGNTEMEIFSGHVEKGVHEYHVAMEGLASGIYIARVTGQGINVLHKLLLLK